MQTRAWRARQPKKEKHFNGSPRDRAPCSLNLPFLHLSLNVTSSITITTRYLQMANESGTHLQVAIEALRRHCHQSFYDRVAVASPDQVRDVLKYAGALEKDLMQQRQEVSPT